VTEQVRVERRAATAAAQVGTVLAFTVAAAPLQGLQVRKKLERARF